MAKSLTVQDFFKMFPTDEDCLKHLFKTRFGADYACTKCGVIGGWTKLAKLPAYTCNCGHHVHPMAGTFFQDSRTPLQKWFYAMYLFTTTRHGVAAKELQRQLSVTYKTAWRMAHEIRKHMAKVDGDAPLSGVVEVDETVVGGRRRGMGTGRTKMAHKAIVFGMLERDGDVAMRVVDDAKRDTLFPHIEANVTKGTMIHSDEYAVYRTLPLQGYKHLTVDHSKKEYARGEIHTNAIENMWAQLKRSIRGTHIHVSPKHLQKYLGEFEFRFNLRKRPDLMFSRLLAGF